MNFLTISIRLTIVNKLCNSITLVAFSFFSFENDYDNNEIVYILAPLAPLFDIHTLFDGIHLQIFKSLLSFTHWHSFILTQFKCINHIVIIIEIILCIGWMNMLYVVMIWRYCIERLVLLYLLVWFDSILSLVRLAFGWRISMGVFVNNSIIKWVKTKLETTETNIFVYRVKNVKNYQQLKTFSLLTRSYICMYVYVYMIEVKCFSMGFCGLEF